MTALATPPTDVTDLPDHLLLDLGLADWGCWQDLDEGPGYAVRRLSLCPRATLTRDPWPDRSEHWIVVSGTASCTVGPTVRVAGVGERVDVPPGERGSLTNATDSELVLVEVRLGGSPGGELADLESPSAFA